MLPIVFLLLALFAYPLFVPRIFYVVTWHNCLVAITPAILTMLAISFCCFDYHRLKLFIVQHVLPSMLLSVITLICIGHYLSSPNLPVEYLFSSLAWVFIPLWVCLHHTFFSRILPYFLILLWTLNFIQITLGLSSNAIFRGITGNWNWNAALLIVTTPFLIYEITIIAKKIRVPLIFTFTFNVLIAIISLYYVYRSDSKAAWLALLSTLILMPLIIYKINSRYFILLVIFLLLIGTVIVTNSNCMDIIASHLDNDVRIYLWRGTLDLIRENWLTGIWQPLFESCYASHNPTEYYLSVFAAERNVNPHNHLLFFCAANGVIALAAWITVLIFPIKSYLQKKYDVKNLLFLFVYVFLLVMSMVDTVLDVWPLNIIFLTVMGLLWGRCWIIRPKSLFAITPHNRFIFTFGFIFLVLAFIDTGRNIASSYCFRRARIAMDEKKIPESKHWCDLSIAFKPNPENIYQAALIAFYDIKNARQCIKFLDMLKPYTGFDNYVHNNGLRAKALCVIGQQHEAIYYFEQEGKNFPLSIINWYYYLQTLKQLGITKKIEIVSSRLNYVLELRGWTAEQIPILLRQPNHDWDLNGIISKAPNK